MGKKYFGLLNPLRKNNTKGSLSASKYSRINLFNLVVNNSLESQYGIDLLKDSGPWHAYVVKVLGDEEKEQIINMGINYFLQSEGIDGVASSSKPFWLVRARIPELHATMPDPFESPWNLMPVAQANLIEQYPLFAGFEDMNIPMRVNELIMVDFKDKNNLEEGIIIQRPAISDIVQGVKIGTLSAGEVYEKRCSTALGVKSAAGDIMGTGKKSDNVSMPSPSSIEQRCEERRKTGGIDVSKTTSTKGSESKSSKEDYQGPNPYANETSDYPPQHSVPECVFHGTRMSGYDHCPDLFLKKEPRSEEITEGSLLGTLIRMVGTFNPSSKAWHRPINSYISLDTFSIGFAHYWTENSVKLLVKFANQFPEKATLAFGSEPAELMKDPEWVRKYFSPDKNSVPRTRNWLRNHGLTSHHHPRFDWFLAGWHFIAFDKDWLNVYCEEWINTYLGSAFDIMNEMNTKHGFSWNLEYTAGAFARCANSGQGSMKKYVREAVKALGSNAKDERLVVQRVYSDTKLYNKPQRLTYFNRLIDINRPLRSKNKSDYYPTGRFGLKIDKMDDVK